MGGGVKITDKEDRLRKRAEEELQKAIKNGQISESVSEMVHELQVHQAELKIQNEELRSSHEEILSLYNQYHELYDNAPVGYFSLDIDLLIRNVNIEGAKLLGLKKNKIIGRGFSRFIPANERERYYRALIKITTTSETHEVDLQLERGNELFYAHMQIMPLYGRADERYRIVIIDITKNKKNEERLKEAVIELKNSNKELSSFAYITSHDLQEPLRTMSSYAGLLKKRYEGQLDKDADDFIEYMVSGAARMQSMIKGLLDYSHVGTLNEGFKEFNTEDALSNAISNLKSSIEDCNAEITHDKLPVIFADYNKIARVFQNLIGNALKFRKKGVKPEIHISSRKEINEFVFSVSDNGIGMDKQYSKNIFEIFKRIHPIGEYEGTGMGLAIVKRIIELHGGHIWVESELSKGSVFYFTILYKEIINPPHSSVQQP